MMYGGDGWMWGGGWGWLGWVLMTLVMVLFWAAVITAIVLGIRYLGGSRHIAAGSAPGAGPSRPEDVLAERFARGEIDDDEYKRRLALLREHR